jgi:hypothetical protein
VIVFSLISQVTVSSSSLKDDSDNSSSFDSLLEDKITSATEGIEGDDSINERVHYITAQLRRVASESKENALTICDYIEAFVNETNIVPQYKRKQIQLLCYLSSFFYDKREKKQKKLFSEMRRDDVIAYLNSGKKPESRPLTQVGRRLYITKSQLDALLQMVISPSHPTAKR